MTSPFGTGLVGIGGAFLLANGLNDLINHQSHIKKTKVEIIAGGVTLLVVAGKIGYDFGCLTTLSANSAKAVEDLGFKYKDIFENYVISSSRAICFSPLSGFFIFVVGASIGSAGAHAYKFFRGKL